MLEQQLAENTKAVIALTDAINRLLASQAPISVNQHPQSTPQVVANVPKPPAGIQAPPVEPQPSPPLPDFPPVGEAPPMETYDDVPIIDNVQDALKRVAQKFDRDAARAILTALGVETVAALKPNQYTQVIANCNTKLGVV